MLTLSYSDLGILLAGLSSCNVGKHDLPEEKISALCSLHQFLLPQLPCCQVADVRLETLRGIEKQADHLNKTDNNLLDISGLRYCYGSTRQLDSLKEAVNNGGACV